jgi:hypothetical protein
MSKELDCVQVILSRCNGLSLDQPCIVAATTAVEYTGWRPRVAAFCAAGSRQAQTSQSSFSQRTGANGTPPIPRGKLSETAKTLPRDRKGLV